MRRTVALVMMLVVTGCARKSPDPQVVVPHPAPVSGPSIAADPGLAGPDTVYQGRTAQQWSPMLEGRDATERQQAGAALSRMGSPGAAALLRGMQNRSPAVRLASLQAATRQQLLERRNDSMAVLRSMLADRDPEIRRGAAIRIAWFGKESATALKSLRKLAEEDEDPAVRRAAADAVSVLDERGKSPGGPNRRRPPPLANR